MIVCKAFLSVVKSPENRMDSGENGKSFFLLVNHLLGLRAKTK